MEHDDLKVVKTQKLDISFDLPIYIVCEAARALDVPATTLSTWAFGHARRPARRREHRGEAHRDGTSHRARAKHPICGFAAALSSYLDQLKYAMSYMTQRWVMRDVLV
jgi:hypothetical protein